MATQGGGCACCGIEAQLIRLGFDLLAAETTALQFGLQPLDLPPCLLP